LDLDDGESKVSVAKDTNELLQLLENAGKEIHQDDYFKLKREEIWEDQLADKSKRDKEKEKEEISIFSIDLGLLENSLNSLALSDALNILDPFFLELEESSQVFVEPAALSKVPMERVKLAPEIKSEKEDLDDLEELLKTAGPQAIVSKEKEKETPNLNPVPNQNPIGGKIVNVPQENMEELEAMLDEILDDI